MARGLDAGKYFWRSGREKCFSLDIPFNRTSGQRRLEVRPLGHNFRFGMSLLQFLGPEKSAVRHFSILELPSLNAPALWL